MNQVAVGPVLHSARPARRPDRPPWLTALRAVRRPWRPLVSRLAGRSLRSRPAFAPHSRTRGLPLVGHADRHGPRSCLPGTPAGSRVRSSLALGHETGFTAGRSRRAGLRGTRYARAPRFTSLRSAHRRAWLVLWPPVSAPLRALAGAQRRREAARRRVCRVVSGENPEWSRGVGVVKRLREWNPNVE